MELSTSNVCLNCENLTMDSTCSKHQLDVKLNNSSRYINLGDWITHFTYAELKGSSVSLKKYNS